jgi:hypothetical protein
MMEARGLFLLAMLCSMGGAALFGFFCSPRGLAQIGIARGGMQQGLGIAGGLLLAAVGGWIIVVHFL